MSENREPEKRMATAKELAQLKDSENQQASSQQTQRPYWDKQVDNAIKKAEYTQAAAKGNNDPNQTERFADAQITSDARDGAFLEDETKARTPEAQVLDEENLKRQHILRDARDGEKPFTAGGDRDITWSPDQSGPKVAEPVQPSVPPTDVETPPKSKKELADERAIARDLSGETYTDSLSDIMPQDEKARYENFFNQERPKTGNQLYEEALQPQQDALIKKFEDRAKDLEEGSSTQTGASINSDSPEIRAEGKPTDPNIELINANKELVEAVNKLIKTLEDLKTTSANDPQMQLIIKNLLIGVGNIVNAEGQSTITTGDGSIKNELNVGVGDQPTTETTSTGTPVVEKKKGEEEKTSKVDELEELQKEKEELEKKLNDPNISVEDKQKTQQAITDIEDVIKKAEEVIKIEQQQAADKVTQLTEEDKKEIDEAGRKKEGFFATITRAFKGTQWKGFWRNAALSTGSALAVTNIAGLAIATGPIGMGLVGATMVVLGARALKMTYNNLRDTAKSQGMSIREYYQKDWRVAAGTALGGTLSAVTRLGFAAVVPGVGPILPVLGLVAENIISGVAEAKLNKKQEELVNKYLTTYEARRYSRLQEAGYISREGINIEKILSDMTDKNVPADEQKTAQKTAIAALAHLYNQTKDERYRYIHYTVTENNQEVRKQIDITDIGVEKVDGDSDTNRMLQLKGINFETVVDKLDLEELKALTLEASTHSSLTDRKGLTNEIVGYFVGLETVDVENLLSSERENYLQFISFLTGFRTGTGVVNSAVLIGSGTSLTYNTIKTELQGTSSTHNQVEQEYRDNLGDSDADIDSYVREDGTRVNTIDLDNDDTPDLIHDTSTNEYSAVTVSGAEKLFEIQNPEFGNVTITEFESSSTGITGTLVTDTGEVAGVIYNDPSGNIGVINNTQLSQALGATSGGSATTVSITDIQPNGSTVLNIGGQTYNTNLSELANIPGSSGIEGSIGVDPLTGVVQPNDSVPSILTKIMQQVKEFNPNLAKYDDYELQRSLYRGDRLSNDSTIRSELGLSNPVQSNQEFTVRESPTILGWLEGLNGGPVSLPDVGAGTPGTSETSGINFAFSGPNVNIISLENLTPVEVDTSGHTLTLGHLGAIGAAALGIFLPGQVGGIVKTSKIEFKEGESKEPDPTPKPVQPPITPEKEKEYISQVLRTQIFAYSKDRIKLTSSTFKLGESKLIATESGWILNEKPIGNDSKEIDEIITEFLKLDREEQAKVLTNMLDKMTVLKGNGRRVTLSDSTAESSVIFRKLKDGKWQEVSAIENAQRNPGSPETREIITSAQLADRILLIQRDEQKKVVGSIVPPTAKAAGTQVSSTNQQGGKKAEEAAKPGIEASAKAETENAEGKEKVDEFLLTVKGIVQSLNNKFKPVTVAGNDYVYHADTKLWKLSGEAKNGKAQLTDKELFGLFTSSHNSTEKNIKEKLSKDLETMLGRLTEDGTPHGKKNDRVKVGSVSYIRVRGTNELVWKSKDENLTDKELANKIVGLPIVEASTQANTEQAEKSNEKKEQEKPEKKARKLLKAALLVVGIGGGIATGLAGIGGPVALGAATVSLGTWIGEGITKWRESSLKKQYDEIAKEVEERAVKTYTAEDTKKRQELEKKMESTRKWREHIGTVAWLTTPLAISSGLTALMAPEITSAGIEIKSWLEGAWNSMNVDITRIRQPFNIGTK